MDYNKQQEAFRVKKKAKTVIDIAMICLLPMMMAYSLIGERIHEWNGTIIFVLFIVHHVMNRNWYRALPKGKYSGLRLFRTILDFFLLLFMILQPVSGILMSKHLYTFLPSFPISAKAREIHLFLAYWGFVLMSVHAGTHLTAPLSKLRKWRKNVWITVLAAVLAISVYGIYAFFKRSFPGYMFMKNAFVFFDFSEPIVFFFLDYIAIMILYAAIGFVIVSVLKESEKKRGRGIQ